MSLESNIISEYVNEVESLFLIEREEYIELQMIRIKKEFRNKGIANILMERLCKYADDMNKIILLDPISPKEESDVSKSRLIDFYLKFGFRLNKKKDYSLPTYSYKREPFSY